MSQPDRGDYLGRHLYHELQCLLCAATEWRVQQTINPNDSIPGQHIKMYAMDSAALHARALFEFLTSNTVPNHVGIDLYAVNRRSHQTGTATEILILRSVVGAILCTRS